MIYLIFRRDFLKGHQEAINTPIGYLKDKTYKQMEDYLTKLSIENKSYIGENNREYPYFYVDTLIELKI